MNCLLMREISVKNTVRMWDTYLVRSLFCAASGSGGGFIDTNIDMDGSVSRQAEGPDAFSQFHLYVCSAFLVRWSEKLRGMDFQVRKRSHRRSVLYWTIFSRCAPRINITPGHHHVLAVLANARLDGPRN
jgi:hypothetical protein